VKASEHGRPIAQFDLRRFNGVPALFVEFADEQPRAASRLVQQCTLAPDGRIKEIYAVLATRKLARVHHKSAGSPLGLL
jgi:hypothetical protein